MTGHGRKEAAGPAEAAPSAEPLIEIELRRGPLHLNVRWPSSAAGDYTAWLRELSSGYAQVIRIDQLWLCTAPMDMRAGIERLLSCLVQTTGAAHAHHGYLFANARARIKLLVHDGFGVWCAARRLNAGHLTGRLHEPQAGVPRSP